jgi:hypothetical protein
LIVLELHAIPWDHIPWDELDRLADRTVFQTREWLEFIAETQNGTPVVAELRYGGALAGYFSGVLIRKLGVRILGSPFPGWTTPYIGFNLLPGTITRRQATEGLRLWAFGQMGCWHFEVSDWQFRNEGTVADRLELEPSETYDSDLTQTEEELLGRMRNSCRWSIRKAEKSGVTIEEAVAAGFADEHYVQLQDVFARQGLNPTYGVERVRALVRRLHPTGRLVLLRARNPEGRSIATGIYPAFNQLAHLWGTASLRAEQHWRGNDLMHWYALRYLKRMGVKHFNWGGSGGHGHYKEKYGGVPASIPWFCGSKYQAIAVARKGGHDLYYQRRRIIGLWRGFRQQPAPIPGE